MKVAALNIEADTNEFGFTPGVSPRQGSARIDGAEKQI